MVSSSPDPQRPQRDPPGLRVEVAGDRQVTTVYVEGDVDLATAGLLSAAADRALDGAPLRVVVNLSQVTFFSAAGLTVLLRLRERADRAAIDLVLREPSPAVRTVLDIVDAARHFRIDPAGQSLNTARGGERGQSLASKAAI